MYADFLNMSQDQYLKNGVPGEKGNEPFMGEDHYQGCNTICFIHKRTLVFFSKL